MSYTDLISSSISTAIAEIITLPICTIKTNYQTNLNHKSIFNVYNDIKTTRGFYGFYDASAFAIISQIASTATKFTFYSYIKKYRNTDQKDIKNNIINGAIGGSIASVFSHPFDVLKIHKQTNKPFIQEFKNVGPSLMYRGWSKSLTKNILLTSIVFPFYDFYKSKFNNPIIAAGLSASTATLVIHPIDYLKVRHISNQPLYPSFGNMSNYFKYYYRGVHVNLMRVVPHFIITMVITENLKQKFAQ